jgi:hypothetical protein
MAGSEDDLDAAHLQALAAKCRRLADNMSDETTIKALRAMAAEYENLAKSKNLSSEPRPPTVIG